MSDALEERLRALERRVRALEDERAIRHLIVDYGLAVDVGNGAAAAGAFTEDGVYDVDVGTMTGRDAVQAMVDGPRLSRRSGRHPRVPRERQPLGAAARARRVADRTAHDADPGTRGAPGGAAARTGVRAQIGNYLSVMPAGSAGPRACRSLPETPIGYRTVIRLGSPSYSFRDSCAQITQVPDFTRTYTMRYP